MQAVSLEKAKTYIIVFRIIKDVRVCVGRLNELPFRRGFYLYIGSAKKNLEARIRRYTQKTKNVFWHIDYLLSLRSCRIVHILIGPGIQECAFARRLLRHGYRYVAHFGSSDCNCKSHLFFVNNLFFLKSLLDAGGFCYANKDTFR